MSGLILPFKGIRPRIASSAFIVVGFALNALGKRPMLEHLFAGHVAATVILFLIWILPGRGLSHRGLLRLDAAGTILAAIGYIAMARAMPESSCSISAIWLWPVTL